MADELFCDLHMHSTASDGTDPPQALGALAKATGVQAIALTDHDTTAGLVDCANGCREAGVEFVPGIEVSADPGPLADHPDDGSPVLRRGTLHILGLFVRHDDPLLLQISQQMKDARDTRNPAIVERLREQGIDIQYEEVESLARRQGTRVIGRPHIGQVLIDKGVVNDMSTAFKQFIGQGGSAYVRRDRLPPQHAIDSIHHAGGLAVLAHPVQLHYASLNELERIIGRLREMGLDGIETHHSDHNPEQIDHFSDIAQHMDLLTSGGSDYHGSRKPVKLGQCRVPYEKCAALQSAANR